MALKDETEALTAQLFDETNIGENQYTETGDLVVSGPNPVQRPTTIQPIKDEPITDFYKRTGHASLEEFMQDPSNAGKIKTTAKGIAYVLEGMDYQVKPGGLVVEGGATDISAPKLPEDEGGISPLTGREVLPGSGDKASDLAEFTVDTKEEGVLGPPPVLAPGDEVTPSKQEMVADFTSVPVVEEPKLEGPPVVEEEIAEVTEEPGVVPGDRSGEATAKHTKQIIIDSSPKESQPVIKDVLDEIDALGYEVPDNKYYEDIAKNINDKITGYNTKISAVAEEKMKPTFEGWDKFLAVLGSALGAYGSSMTGVPNFALQIVNKAIDRDTQAFLKSKEARTKSLENQRMDLIMMRGEKLQMAQNRVTQLMQSATFELSKTKTKADIKAIYDKLAQELALNKENMQLVLAGYIKDIVIGDMTIKASSTKEMRKRYVNTVTGTDSKGNPFTVPGYFARSEKAAEKLTEDQELAQEAFDILDELNVLHEDNTKFLPTWASETSQKINTLSKRLEVILKEHYGMGANYVAYEQTLIQGIMPTAKWHEKFGIYKTKSALLRDQFINTLKNKAKVRGATGESEMPSTAGQTNIERFKGEAGAIKTSK